ncbi:MAG: ribokinase [Telluria sp.]
MTPRITVVGSINMDLVFRTARMPARGETMIGEGFHLVPGGKGANQAVAAARQGARVRLIGAVGTDAFGRDGVAALAAEGIDVSAVSSVTTAPSGVAGICVDGSGANAIVLAPGANLAVSVEQVEQAAALIAASDFLVCQLEIPLATTARALALAHAAGVRTLFNPAPAQAIDDALLAQVDYLVVNETEAGQLTGLQVDGHANAQAAARALRARGAGTVLVTMGGCGVQVCADGVDAFAPALKVAVVDTTAAGDTFVGALAVALAQGESLMDAVAYAQHAAALTVMRMGAQTSIPLRREVLELMKQN